MMINGNLLKDIAESNLSLDTKVELMKLLLRDNERPQQSTIYYPYLIEVPQQNWWNTYTITC